MPYCKYKPLAGLVVLLAKLKTSVSCHKCTTHYESQLHNERRGKNDHCFARSIMTLVECYMCLRVPLHLTVRLSSLPWSPGAGNSNLRDSGCKYFAGSSLLQFLDDFLDAEDTLLDDFLLSIQFRKKQNTAHRWENKNTHLCFPLVVFWQDTLLWLAWIF